MILAYNLSVGLKNLLGKLSRLNKLITVSVAIFFDLAKLIDSVLSILFFYLLNQYNKK